MNDATKRKIKNVARAAGRGAKDIGGKAAKFGGKWTLKGIGKTAELAGRASVGVANTLVRSTDFQKLATASGIIVAGVMAPPVLVGVVGTLMGKCFLDRKQLENKQKGIADEMADIVNFGHRFTKHAFGAIGDILDKSDEKIIEAGQKVQYGIDELFER